jgi:hypothetical protein
VCEDSRRGAKVRFEGVGAKVLFVGAIGLLGVLFLFERKLNDGTRLVE